jgi:hypothetical protein
MPMSDEINYRLPVPVFVRIALFVNLFQGPSGGPVDVHHPELEDENAVLQPHRHVDAAVVGCVFGCHIQAQGLESGWPVVGNGRKKAKKVVISDHRQP